VLELMTSDRGNEAAVQDLSDQCHALLRQASVQLKILDPELGSEELLTSVAAELAKSSLPLREPGDFVLYITPTPPFTPTSPFKRREKMCS